MSNTSTEGLSRRQFLATLGALTAGTLLGAGGLSLVSSKNPAGSESNIEVPTWPWPYKRLDPKIVARRGYEGYYEGACCYGAAKAILMTLCEEVGYPYNLFPIDVFRYGEGGVVGWSTLCGALNGASAVINLVTPKGVYGKLINELMGWYCQHAFPDYTPEGGAELVKSVSGSPLCHVSVTLWCKASGFQATSKERAERCGRLTADVAARAVELLNSHFDGGFVATYKPPESLGQCMSCHGKEGMNNTRGLMDCVQCHGTHEI